MSNVDVFDFPDEGVTVIVPKQTNKKKIKVKKKIFDVDSVSKEPGEFTYRRNVIDILLVDSDTDEPIGNYVPPIELHVKLAKDDKEQAGKDIKKIKIAFWDGNKWIQFDKNKHQLKYYDLEVGIWAGYAIAYISNWIDPPIALGT